MNQIPRFNEWIAESQEEFAFSKGYAKRPSKKSPDPETITDLEELLYATRVNPYSYILASHDLRDSPEVFRQVMHVLNDSDIYDMGFLIGRATDRVKATESSALLALANGAHPVLIAKALRTDAEFMKLARDRVKEVRAMQAQQKITNGFKPKSRDT
jgi:hypothetical protein